MKRRLLLGLILAAVALATVGVDSYGTAAARRVTKTHQFRCTDRNQSLYFLVYEIDGHLDRGLMYVENMQVANMSVEWAGTNFIKAKVNGNTANVAFLLGKDGNLMVANYTTSTRVPVCHASYAYR
ncbi:MAG: hypothetical protein LC754_10925 [Acidobacteria bacterium]|nr:hypothetical protein [Acidobacteriota bacterium]